MRRTGFCWSLAPAFLLFTSSTVAAQGVTTSALTGTVTSSEGQPITSATVTAVHVPSGTQYRASVTSSGRYNLPNLRIGGPYKVTATSIGYEPRSENEVADLLGVAKSQAKEWLIRLVAEGALETVKKTKPLRYRKVTSSDRLL